MEALNKIFGGKERVKMMRIFLLNPDKVYTLDKVANGTGLGEKKASREVSSFEKVGLLKKRNIRESKNGTKKEVKKNSKRIGWILNDSFLYLPYLQSLLVKTAILDSADLLKRLKKGANLKLVVISGIFLQNWDSRVDLLVVGEKIKKRAMEKIVKTIESEIGRELSYSILDVTDFHYRLSISDKLIRDIFDFPHETILDRIGLGR